MDTHEYLLRLPKPLWEKLKARAALSRRSANSEIVVRLEESLTVDGVGRVASSAPSTVSVTPDFKKKHRA